MKFGRANVVDTLPLRLTSLPTGVPLLQSPLFIAIEAGVIKKYGMEVCCIATGVRTIQALVGGLVRFARVFPAARCPPW